MMVHKYAAARMQRRGTPVYRVTVIKVRPMVWREALRLSNGDPRRIVIIDAETVVVKNPCA